MDNLQPFDFYFKGKASFGIGVIKNIGNELFGLSIKRLLIVTDKGVVEAGILESINAYLEQAGIEYHVFDGVESNVRAENIEDGAQKYRENKCQGILAVGGGSPIDAGKGVALRASNEGHILDYQTVDGIRTITAPLPVMIAVPTTSGTGSELTPAAVVTDSSSRRKVVLADRALLPQLAIVDPELTRSMPPHLTAWTGLDALTHAIENYLSVRAEPITDALSLQAIALVGNNLRQAVANGENMKARYAMSVAAAMAGLAFGNSGLGIVHSLAHALGGLYDVQHGLANAVFLPYVMEFNSLACPEKYRNIAGALGEKVGDVAAHESIQMAINAVKRLNEELSIPGSIKDLGAEESAVDKLAENALRDHRTIAANPRRVTREDLIELCRKHFY